MKQTNQCCHTVERKSSQYTNTTLLRAHNLLNVNFIEWTVKYQLDCFTFHAITNLIEFGVLFSIKSSIPPKSEHAFCIQQHRCDKFFDYTALFAADRTRLFDIPFFSDRVNRLY